MLASWGRTHQQRRPLERVGPMGEHRCDVVVTSRCYGRAQERGGVDTPHLWAHAVRGCVCLARLGKARRKGGDSPQPGRRALVYVSSAVSGRVAELRRDSLLIRSGMTRDVMHLGVSEIGGWSGRGGAALCSDATGDEITWDCRHRQGCVVGMQLQRAHRRVNACGTTSTDGRRKPSVRPCVSSLQAVGTRPEPARAAVHVDVRRNRSRVRGEDGNVQRERPRHRGQRASLLQRRRPRTVRGRRHETQGAVKGGVAVRQSAPRIDEDVALCLARPLTLDRWEQAKAPGNPRRWYQRSRRVRGPIDRPVSWRSTRDPQPAGSETESPAVGGTATRAPLVAK